MSVSKQDSGTSGTKDKDPLIGKQLGDYRITSRLAAGGMARIYKAMDYKLQRPAAIKILDGEMFANDQTTATRFKREARAVAALEHENIITIYQYGEDEEENIYFLAMKLVRGKDLADELKRIHRRNKLMDIDRALNIMTQIASALDYAHSQDIVHRDVKPSNILLDKGDKAILTDLGLVLRSTAETTMGTAFGTPRYISPEQATSSDQATPQSDIYSFGVIMYEMLTGQTPFDGNSPMEIALAHIGDPVPSPRSLNPAIPKAAERELLKALHKDPTKRHRTAAKFVETIRRAYDKVDATTTPGSKAKVVANATDRPVTNATNTIKDALAGVRVIGEQAAKSRQRPRVNIPLGAALTAITSRFKAVTSVNISALKNPLAGARVVGESAQGKKGRPRALIFLIAIALLIVIAFIANGLISSPGVVGDGAPVTLIYTDTTFTLINEGDYTLNVQALKFVRGADDGVDDFSGDRIPRDQLPPDRNCYQIVLANSSASVPPQCDPIQQHRQGQETMNNAQRVPWRSETTGSERISSFTVIYAGRELARCDTVARGESGECHFTWPVAPPDES